MEPQLSQALAAVIKDGRFVLGPAVTELETELAAFCHAQHCITCSSGSDALVLILLALNIGAGDAVLLPDFTFIATAEAVARVGATPIFVDVLGDSFNINPQLLPQAWDIARQAGLKPTALIAVDLFGQPADYQALQAFCEQHQLHLIADAAQSFGAQYHQRTIGTLGVATAVSFFPAKPLGCYGDGGCIFTQDPHLAQKLRSLRQHGQGSHRYEHISIGLNARLDSIQAVILKEKLRIFPDELQRRQRVAQRYHQILQHALQTPQIPPHSLSTWAQYTILSPHRDNIIAACQQQKIPTAIYYPIPLHQQPAYRHFPCASASPSITQFLSQQVLSLPMHPYLSTDTQDLITATVLKALA